jgi:hypothetical protein
MKRTYALTRIPSHSELQAAFARLPRATRDTVSTLAQNTRNVDLGAAFQNDDPETLNSQDRRAIAQLMHDRGAAFMLSTLPKSA